MIRKCTVALFLLSQALLVGWMGWVMCPTMNEAGHIAATVYFWRTLRFDVFYVNPPLTHIVGGLPIILCDPKCDWDSYSSRPDDRSEWGLGWAFLKTNGRADCQRYFALARWALVPLLLLGGYFGYRLTRDLYGDTAALLFLTLWCSSPLLMGLGATLCPDAVAGALGLVAIYALRQWLHQPNWTRAIVAGGCLGLLPLTKTTWITAFGIWPVIWCFWAVSASLTTASNRSMPPPFRHLVVILLVGVYTLNLGYLFDGTCRPLGRYVFISQSLTGRAASEDRDLPVTGNRFSGTWLGVIPVPLPADFVRGIDAQRVDFERGFPSYLRGEWADHGWWYYYLYALVVKVPLGTWWLIALAMILTILRQGYSASWRDEMLVLVPFVVILVVVSSQTGFSVHSRYILPAVPFLFVWAAKVGRLFELRPFTRTRLVMAATVLLALTWSVSGSLAIYPHSLSYFNELAAALPTPADASYPKAIGRNEQDHSVLSTIKSVFAAGPLNGPRHLLDSNIDWGQDLFCLKDWLDTHSDIELDGLAYWGSYPATLAGIPETPSPPIALTTKGAGPGHTTGDGCATEQFGPKPGCYALSVNQVYDRSQRYRYFLHFEPVAMAGYSIYIYHITPKEANRVRKELGMPELTEGQEHEEVTVAQRIDK